MQTTADRLFRDLFAIQPCKFCREADRLPEDDSMILRVEIEREEDGRWIAEIPELSGALCYGDSEAEARSNVQALALRILADRLEHGEQSANLSTISFAAA